MSGCYQAETGWIDCANGHSFEVEGTRGGDGWHEPRWFDPDDEDPTCWCGAHVEDCGCDECDPANVLLIEGAA